MARALARSVLNLKDYVFASEARIQKLFSFENEAGKRATPTGTDKNDQDFGTRIDFGEVFTKDGITYRRVKLQANKQASDPTLKKMAAKDSHKVYAVADLQIDPKPQDRRQAVSELFSDLEDDIEV